MLVVLDAVSGFVDVVVVVAVVVDAAAVVVVADLMPDADCSLADQQYATERNYSLLH